MKSEIVVTGSIRCYFENQWSPSKHLSSAAIQKTTEFFPTVEILPEVVLCELFRTTTITYRMSFMVLKCDPLR